MGRRFPPASFTAARDQLVADRFGHHHCLEAGQAVGTYPLIFAITYMAGNAIFRNSGGRYILPVDWSNIHISVLAWLISPYIVLRVSQG